MQRRAKSSPKFFSNQREATMAKATAKATSKKFKPAVMTRRGGGKNTEHGPGWIAKVAAAVAAGTPAEQKRHPISYHGVAPHVEDVPPGPRPSVAPVEPTDMPGADDQTRKVDPTPFPTTHGHKSPGKSGKVPATCGASAAQPPVDPFAKG
jgi:hypothetical protein